MLFLIRRLAVLCFLLCSWKTILAVQDDPASTAVDIFSKRCIECHNASDPSGELDLTSKDSAYRGGASGKAFLPGNANASLMLAKVSSGEMPPEKNGKSQKIPESEIVGLSRWVDSGAAWPAKRVLDLYDRTSDFRAGRDWWSLQEIRKPQPPTTASHTLLHPIDAFILQKLLEQGLSPAPAANKRTLMRRLYHDLIGLPPSPDEIESFVLDNDPDAYERRVDELLARPQFGERWARHWLDVVRYADTNGYERDAEKAHAWKYRDWVVNAFNSDMPYDRFLIEQLAGDELPDRNESSVIATGLLRLGTWDDEPNDAAEYKYDRLEDLVHVTSTAFMGLTVKCARCHDHKFDPILQADYYRMGAAFWPGPVAHRDRALNGGPTKEELGFEVLGWTDITSDPTPLHSLKKGDIHQPLQPVEPGPLSSFVKIPFPPVSLSANAKTTGRRLQLARWMTTPNHPITSRVIVNRIWQHLFGEGLVRTPDNLGFNGQLPTHPELLDWLASELVDGNWHLKRLHKAMVMSKTYQQSSQHPQHTELSIADPGNGLLWRSHRGRLDAESLRDAILFTSDQLETTLGGPSFKAPIDSEALEGLSMKGKAYTASPKNKTLRRSLYMYHKRSLMVPFMTTFDICDTTMPTGRREATVVATQALAMLNSDWVHDQCRVFANRVISYASTTAERIDTAWKLALGRLPSDRERKSAEVHLQKQADRLVHPIWDPNLGNAELLAWASLCHVLINTNEFIYVD
jgi:Protein of unknown function (DUF1553)/Protein of unknown function (DUF1549)/Planctomycete cytochrome C